MLEQLLKDTEGLTAWVDWVHGIEFELAYVGRPELDALVRKHTRAKFVKGRAIEQLDEDAFSLALVKRAIKGWRGVTVGALAKVLPIEIGELDPDTVVEFTPADMAVLANGAYGFAGWLNTQMMDLEQFRASRLEDEVKN